MTFEEKLPENKVVGWVKSHKVVSACVAVALVVGVVTATATISSNNGISATVPPEHSGTASSPVVATKTPSATATPNPSGTPSAPSAPPTPGTPVAPSTPDTPVTPDSPVDEPAPVTPPAPAEPPAPVSPPVAPPVEPPAPPAPVEPPSITIAATEGASGNCFAVGSASSTGGSLFVPSGVTNYTKSWDGSRWNIVWYSCM